jgi:hypothetical protein
MKKPINEIAKMRRIAGLITESEYQEALQEENKFYSRDYVSQKYGNKAKEIEDNIEDENPNVWDIYTSLETPEEVDEFVSGYLDEALQEENSTPSKELRQAVLKYIKPEYQDKVENTYDRYINFLKAYTKPVTGNDRKEIYPAIVKNLVKAKSIDPSEILNHYRVENLDLLGDLMFKNSDVALSVLKKLDQANDMMNENQSSSLDVTDKKAVLQFLANNGIDDDYFESMGGKEIESGGDEWLEVLSVLTGKDAYTDEFDVEDDKKISDFLITLDRLGIDFV